MESPSIALDKLASCAGLLPTVAADAVHDGTAEVEVIDLETQTKKQSEAIEVFKAAGEDSKRLGAEQLNHLKAQLALAREHAEKPRPKAPAQRASSGIGRVLGYAALAISVSVLAGILVLFGWRALSPKIFWRVSNTCAFLRLMK